MCRLRGKTAAVPQLSILGIVHGIERGLGMPLLVLPRGKQRQSALKRRNRGVALSAQKGKAYQSMTELDDNSKKDLFLLLSAMEDKIPPSLYALKIQLEKEIYQKYSIFEIEEMKIRSRIEYDKEDDLR